MSASRPLPKDERAAQVAFFLLVALLGLMGMFPDVTVRVLLAVLP